LSWIFRVIAIIRLLNRECDLGTIAGKRNRRDAAHVDDVGNAESLLS